MSGRQSRLRWQLGQGRAGQVGCMHCVEEVGARRPAAETGACRGGDGHGPRMPAASRQLPHLSLPGSSVVFSFGVARSMAISLPFSTCVWLITSSTASSKEQGHAREAGTGVTPSAWRQARGWPLRMGWGCAGSAARSGGGQGAVAVRRTRLWAAVGDKADASVALLGGVFWHVAVLADPKLRGAAGRGRGRRIKPASRGTGTRDGKAGGQQGLVRRALPTAWPPRGSAASRHMQGVMMKRKLLRVAPRLPAQSIGGTGRRRRRRGCARQRCGWCEPTPPCPRAEQTWPRTCARRCSAPHSPP